MKHFFDKTRLAFSTAVGSLVIVMAMVAPQVSANGYSGSSGGLDLKVQELENQLRSIQSEMDRVKSEAAREAQEAERLETRMDQQEENYRKDHAELITDRKGRMLFFRGGYTHANQGRNGSSIQSAVVPIGAQESSNQDGWYVGAGIDFGLTKDVWGLMPKTDVKGEIMFEYKQFGGKIQGNALANEPSQLAGGALNPRGVTVSQFTLTAAPKIKFMDGSKIRPWIIPAGLAIHVISPTSESVTYLAPGVMFGAGVDYNIWEDFFIGIDARYHLTAGKADGVRVDGLTAGGYLGIGF